MKRLIFSSLLSLIGLFTFAQSASLSSVAAKVPVNNKVTTSSVKNTGCPGSYYNLTIGYNVSSVRLDVYYSLPAGHVSDGNMPCQYGANFVMTTSTGPSTGSATFLQAIVPPNQEQTLYFNNQTVKFKWPGSGSQCEVICQPGVSCSCPGL